MSNTINNLVISAVTVEFTKNGSEYKATMSAAAFKAVFVDNVPLEDDEPFHTGFRGHLNSRGTSHQEQTVTTADAVVSILDEVHKAVVKVMAINLTKCEVKGKRAIKLVRTVDFANEMLRTFPNLESAIKLRMVSGELRPTPTKLYERALANQEEFVLAIRNPSPTYITEEHPLYELLMTKMELECSYLMAYRQNNMWGVKF